MRSRVAGRANDFMNSIGRGSAVARARHSHNPAFLNPADLIRFGITAGDLIEIRSAHGEIRGIAQAEAKLRPGTLSMTHCFGPNPGEAPDVRTQGSCTSRLIDSNAEFDPVFGQPRMGAIPVSIRRTVPSDSRPAPL